MRKIKFLVVSMILLLLTFSCAFAESYYSDLSGENQKYKIAAEVLTELKAVDYFSDGEYKPNLNTITKAEFIKALIAANGLLDEVPETVEEAPYEKVPVSHWAAGYITLAKERGLIREDGTTIFEPDADVTYAYALTSALLSLGYNDESVSVSGTTYPTNYMLKAVEVNLTKDISVVSANDNLTRGDMALIFWNMLRTPMNGITGESEGEGMTLSSRYSKLLLNVRFPDYLYMDKTYVNSLDIANASDVSLTVNTNDALDLHTAHVTDIDLQKMIVGEQVEVLIKQYKDSDNAKYLVVNPENTIVEGFVQNVTYGTPTTITISGESYTIKDDISSLVKLEPTDYLILEVNSYNNKVVKYGIEDEYVYKFASTDGIFMKTQSQIAEIVKENDLVIIDGNWGTVDDVEIGNVLTKVTFSDGVYYWVANSEVRMANFDMLFDEKISLGENEYNVTKLTLDDEDMFISPAFEAYRGENNNTKISENDLKVVALNNLYTGKAVEVYSNYLGLPVRINFGYVDVSKSDFFVVTSNTSVSEGTYYITFVNVSGYETEYSVAQGVSIPERLLNEDLYTNYDLNGPTFVWATLNENNEISAIQLLEEGLTTSKYGIAKIIDGAKITNEAIPTTAGTLPVPRKSYYYVVTAERDTENRVVSLNVTVSVDRTDYEDVTLPNGTLVAYDNDNRAKYFFIENVKEPELQWGRVNTINLAKEEVEIDTTIARKLDTSSVEASKKDLVKYMLDKNEEIVTIKGVFDLDELDDALILDGNKRAEMDDEDLEDYLPLTEGKFTLDPDDNDYKAHKDYSVWGVSIQGKVNEYFEVTRVEKIETKGHAGVAELVNDWDRIVVLDEDKTILVFTGIFDEDTITSVGMLYVPKKGDLDDTKTITIVDVRLLLQAYINSTTETQWSKLDLAVMDMDNNDKVDIVDVRLLLQEYINH